MLNYFLHFPHIFLLKNFSMEYVIYHRWLCKLPKNYVAVQVYTIYSFKNRRFINLLLTMNHKTLYRATLFISHCLFCGYIPIVLIVGSFLNSLYRNKMSEKPLEKNLNNRKNRMNSVLLCSVIVLLHWKDKTKNGWCITVCDLLKWEKGMKVISFHVICFIFVISASIGI